MKTWDKLLSIYSKANPFVQFLTVSSLISGSTTLCTDIGNIISTAMSEPTKTYESIEIDDNIYTANNMFQTSL